MQLFLGLAVSVNHFYIASKVNEDRSILSAAKNCPRRVDFKVTIFFNVK